MTVTFRPPDLDLRNRLWQALYDNAATEQGGAALKMGRDTGFVGTAEELDEGQRVIDAILSTPTHY